MTLVNQPSLGCPPDITAIRQETGAPASGFNVTLLTGGIDKPYAFGLSMALVSKGVMLDVIGSTMIESPEMLAAPHLTFLNLHGDPSKPANTAQKIWRCLIVYWRVICYAATAKTNIFHILWNGKIQLFDRTLLMLYYKLLGKKIVLTAHNVNAAKRDGYDSMLNRLSLKFQYHLVDHIFVHTEKMKEELVGAYHVKQNKVSVIPFGINDSVPDTDLTPSQAKRKLQVKSLDRTILVYGHIRPYKGLEFLVAALRQLADRDDRYRLIIAGGFLEDSREYWCKIQKAIEQAGLNARVLQEIRFIPDGETEIYFKAADVLVLPYIEVFQSGVLFLAYNFGLPVIATDVGSFRDDIVEGDTGYVCRTRDAADLAGTIERYFESSLFRNLDQRRLAIRDFAQSRNSWRAVSETTRNVYARLMAQ